MSDNEWNETAGQKENRGVRGGRLIRGGMGRGRGSYYNRINDEDTNGNNSTYGGSCTIDNGDERSTRVRGVGGDKGKGGRRVNCDGDNSGEFCGNGDQQPPVSDKPRPTYIPPEITDEDCYGVEAGKNFNQYEKIKVQVSGDNVPKHIETFKNSGLREVLLEKLAKCHYTIPTPVQKYSIPIIISGRDMMASAQTGSGKTVNSVNLYYMINHLLLINIIYFT